MSLKLAARLVVFPPYKIADLQENDTATHIEDLSAILPPGTIAILIRGNRVTGTASLYAYPMSEDTVCKIGDSDAIKVPQIIPIKNRELKWANSVANDDWDIFMFGYFVQKRTR